MASLLTCGGSVIGLSTAMLLARDGHHVTVLERDPAPPPVDPADAWKHWPRNGVAQFHQPHNLLSRFRTILDDELPGMVDRLVDAGCIWVNYLEEMPPFIGDRTPREGDDRFPFVTGRRPVVESVLARAAAETDGVEVRRGVAVAELVTGASVIDGVPHVIGVRTTQGEELRADLVIDAMGRRTKLAEWLQAVGGRGPQTESEDCGFVYHTRYFAGPELPRLIGPPVAAIGTISLLTLPGDNGTWSVTVFAGSQDTAIRDLKRADRFTEVVRACPLQAHWLDGQPITDVLSMAGILDRYRRFVVDEKPVVTGIAAVGDAWACTNPSAGRGMTLGLIHTQCLRNVLRTDFEDPEQFQRAWDAATEAEVAPFYWSQIRADRARIAEMDALRQGAEPPPRDLVLAAFGAAMLHDADLFRAALEMVLCLALPEEVFARPALMHKVRAAGKTESTPLPGPNRDTLLRLVRGAR